MKKPDLLPSLLLLFWSWPVCAWGEVGLVRHESTADQSQATSDDQGTSASQFGIPIVGYVFESETGALRPILGTPGASFFGSPIDVGMRIKRAWVSSDRGFALGEMEGSASVFLLDLQPGARATRVLPGVPSGADKIAMSPTGSAFAFAFGNDGHIQIVSGLPNSPAVSSAVDLAVFPGPISSLSVSDDGRAILVASNGAETAAVYLVQSEQQRLIAQATSVQATTFLANSLDAIVVDASANQVRLLKDVTGATMSQILADERNGVSRPLRVQPSADNSRIFILNGGTQEILTVALTTGLVNHLPVDGSAAGMQRLAGDVFQLTDDSKQPALLLDAATAEPRVVFVPSASPSATAAGRSASRDQLPQHRRPLPLSSQSN